LLRGERQLPVAGLAPALSRSEITVSIGERHRFIFRTREGAALVRAFMAVKQKPIRQTAIAFLETLKGKND
jgi:hypothetical protein